jgi:hypothetical protein
MGYALRMLAVAAGVMRLGLVMNDGNRCLMAIEVRSTDG